MNGPETGANDRLDSWKTIATYLGRDVRTVQLWEKMQGLPIHRQHHLSLASVFAFKSELDHWRLRRTQKPKPFRRTSGSLVRAVAIALLCAAILVCTWWNWRRQGGVYAIPALSAYSSPDPEAREQYLRGRHFLAMRDSDGMREALRYFSLSVQRDPHYAQAYLGLAETYNLLGTYEVLPPSESLSKVKNFAGRALQLDGTLAEAYTARAIAASFWEFDWRSAGNDFRRALALNPNSAAAHHWYGEHLINLGLADQALIELKRARDLEPLSLAINSTLGRVYRDSHRYREAVEQCQNAVHLAPRFSMPHWCLAQAYMGDQRYALALPEAELAKSLGSTPLLECDLAIVYARLGRTKEANRVLLTLQQRAQATYVSSYLIAAIFVALEQKDRAFAWLDRAFDQHDSHLTYLALDPRLDSLRSDPRFLRLIKLLKLPERKTVEPTASQPYPPG